MNAFVSEVIGSGDVMELDVGVTGAEQRTGEHNSVERDVVLAHKLNKLNVIRVLPPLPDS